MMRSDIAVFRMLLSLFIFYPITPFDRSKWCGLVWDALHFWSIAHKGYEEESAMAFFPGLPVAVNVLSGIFWYIPKLYIGYIFVNTCIWMATTEIDAISHQLQQSKYTYLFFLFTPQSYLLSTWYTEMPFALFSFKAIRYLHNDKPYHAIALFSIASCFRSNGIVHIGYLAWYVLRQLLLKHHLALGPICCSPLILMPFLLFQWYGYAQFCPGRPWCDGFFSYGYIQTVYWQSGFLLHFQWKHLLNFLTVIPLFLAIILHMPSIPSHGIKAFLVHPLTPHRILLYFYLVYGFLFMHVSTTLRLISSVPMFYMAMANGNRHTDCLYMVYFVITWITGMAFLPPA